jgi:hypothetical protein
MEKIEEVLTTIKESSNEDYLKLLINNLIPFIHKECENTDFSKPFDNYNFRQQQMGILMKEIWPNVELSKKRTGKDAWSLEMPILENIEMKSLSNEPVQDPLKVSFPFDKQNDAKRRLETLEYDGFSFAVMYDEKVRILLLVEDPQTILNIKEVIKQLQQHFIINMEKNIAAGKRVGHDAIRVSFKDILVGDNIFHLWINNTWFKKINAKQCIIELEKFYNMLLESIKSTKIKKKSTPLTEEQKKTKAAKAKATRESKKANVLLL